MNTKLILAIFGMIMMIRAENGGTPIGDGYILYELEGAKRSPSIQSKRHLSPAFDVEEDMGNMRALLDIGKRSGNNQAAKRHISPVYDFERDMGNMQTLMDVGKRSKVSKRGVSPAADIEQDMGNMRSLMDIGKRSSYQESKRHLSPAFDVEEDMGNMRALMDIGKRSPMKRSLSVASDIGDQYQMYNRLFDAGKKKRSAISPAFNFEETLGLSDALERAGRR